MITLIDKSNLLHINFHMAYSSLKKDLGKEDIENVDYPFFYHTILNSLQYLFINNKNIILCGEGKNSLVWRKSIFPGYKTNRDEFKASLMYEKFKEITKEIESVLTYFPCKILHVEGAEGDDVIYALSEKYKDEKVKIISTDKDLIQIINKFENVSLFNPIKKKFIDKQEYIIEEKSIVGDTADGIPGIPGIGEKTFIKMLEDKEFFNNKMKNGNKEIYEMFLEIVDLSRCPFIDKIKQKESEIEFNKLDSDSISEFFINNKLNDLLLRWPSIKSKIELNGGNNED